MSHHRKKGVEPYETSHTGVLKFLSLVKYFESTPAVFEPTGRFTQDAAPTFWLPFEIV